MAKTRSVAIQLNDVLEAVSDDVKGVLETASFDIANETAERLRNNSPQETGDYARGWTVDKKRRGDYVVHNATDYRLTHLLENSHVIRNKKGTYGRTSPGHGQIKHIKPAETWANNEFQKKVQEGLNKI